MTSSISALSKFKAFKEHSTDNTSDRTNPRIEILSLMNDLHHTLVPKETHVLFIWNFFTFFSYKTQVCYDTKTLRTHVPNESHVSYIRQQRVRVLCSIEIAIYCPDLFKIFDQHADPLVLTSFFAF